MDTDRSGFEALLRKAQGGDHSDMRELLEFVRPHLQRVAMKYVDDRDAAETVSDLVQESWVLAWDRLDQFVGAETDEDTWTMFLAWSARIVRNAGLQAMRYRGRQKRQAPGDRVRLRTGGESTLAGGGIEPRSPDPTASAVARDKEQALQVREALDSIDDVVVKEVVRLCFFDGLSYREIAEVLDLTYDQVRDRFHRGMVKIRSRLRP